jgi:hypothetical protein
MSPIEELLQYLLRINEQYAPLSSKHYNFTYLSKLAMLPDDDQAKIDTVLAIASDGVKNTLDTLDIPRIPRLQQKKLIDLFTAVINIQWTHQNH